MRQVRTDGRARTHDQPRILLDLTDESKVLRAIRRCFELNLNYAGFLQTTYKFEELNSGPNLGTHTRRERYPQSSLLEINAGGHRGSIP